uniref:putative nuclease HARBI1 n=1 Tax=Pristiophorus japonicus TaxID=55135 RepID=UPI00398F49AD
MSDEHSLRRLMFRKEVIMELCNLLRAYLAAGISTSTSLSVAVKVTVALNFYATDSFQSPVGDICNISQFAVHCCIRQVTDTPYSKLMDYIKISMSREDQNECTRGFARIAGSPSESRMTCFHTNMSSKVADAGSTDYVTELCAMALQGHSWLLGNKGYGVTPWLMTPLRNPTTPTTQRCNTSHTTTWAIIEQTIGVLKQRFCCLDCSGGAFQYSPDTDSMITIACCMLHNLAIMRGQPLPPGMDDPPQEVDDEEENEELQPRRRQPSTVAVGRAARQRLIAHRFQ